MDELTRRVISVVAKAREMQPANIPVNSSFEDMGFDSVDGYSILFALEEEFDIDIDDETAQQITSVHQIVESLRPVLAEAGKISVTEKG